MTSGREDALPHTHHLGLVADLTGEIHRHLNRLGMMRGLVTVQVGATGGYRIVVTPAASLRLGDFTDLAVGIQDAMAMLDDVLAYDPSQEAAVLVIETNPIDGALLTFMVQDLTVAS